MTSSPHRGDADKLIMGDVIVEAYVPIGFRDVGPRVSMAHEFGHHVEHELADFDTESAEPDRPPRRHRPGHPGEPHPRGSDGSDRRNADPSTSRPPSRTA